jgi:predicted metalloprotease
LTDNDRAEMRAWRNAVPDDIHGRSASQLYWINRGFGTDDFGRCSTWSATKHVR